MQEKPSPLRTQGPSAPAHQQTDHAPSARRFCFCAVDFAFAFALPRATSLIGRTCRASPWERLRREAKAGRGLSDEGGARRGPCGDARARRRSRGRSRACRHTRDHVGACRGEAAQNTRPLWRAVFFVGGAFALSDATRWAPACAGATVRLFRAGSPNFREEQKKPPRSGGFSVTSSVAVGEPPRRIRRPRP